MNIYKIERRFIVNEKMFVMAVLACIYEELKLKAKTDKKEDLGWIEEARKVMDGVVKSYKMIFLYEDNPIEQFKTSDMLELVENATSIIKLQKRVDELVELFNDQIEIDIVGKLPFYMNQVLPDFRNFIIFKEI